MFTSVFESTVCTLWIRSGASTILWSGRALLCDNIICIDTWDLAAEYAAATLKALFLLIEPRLKLTVANPQKKFEVFQTSIILYCMGLVRVPFNPGVFMRKLEGLI